MFRGKFQAEWVHAWDLIKELSPEVRLSSVEKLHHLLAGGRIPRDKLQAALKEHFIPILRGANEASALKLLDRLGSNHVDEAHFDEIITRFEKYPDLKAELISAPDQFEFFDEVLKFPENYRELAQVGEIPTSSPLYKWALGKFRKAILSNAEMLEIYVSDNLDKFINIPEGYKRTRQATLRGIKNTRPDDLIYRTIAETDPAGLLYYRCLIHDTKLHDGVPWTDNQYSEIIQNFEQGMEFLDLELRSIIDEQFGLVPGAQIRIFRSDVYKSVGIQDKTGVYLKTYKVF